MRIRVLHLLVLLTTTLLMASCSSSKSFGDRNISYSKSRASNINFEIPEPSGSTEISYGGINTRPQVKPVPETKKRVMPEAKPEVNTEVSGKDKFAKANSRFRTDLFDTASQFMGLKYKTGGRSPSTGFDCSGFACYVMGQHGIAIGGSSQNLSRLGSEKKKDELEVGDLVFFGSKGRIHHVGIVSENDNGEIKMIHSSSSAGISIDNISKSDYWNSRFLYGRDLISPHLSKDSVAVAKSGR